jgi:hypothetical protein
VFCERFSNLETVEEKVVACIFKFTTLWDRVRCLSQRAKQSRRSFVSLGPAQLCGTESDFCSTQYNQCSKL